MYCYRVMQSPPKIEDIPPKSNLVPDIYALQQMKALQAANPALKALVDARGTSSNLILKSNVKLKKVIFQPRCCHG